MAFYWYFDDPQRRSRGLRREPSVVTKSVDSKRRWIPA